MAGTAAGGVESNVIEDGVVVIEGNRIAAVGRRGEVEVPHAARRIDVSGQTVIPGLVDVHWHGGQGDGEILPEQNWVNLATLAFGVTTLHDPSNDSSEIFTAAEMARAGMVLAPRIFSTGTILYGAAGDFKAVVESYEDALSHLRRMRAVGAISVKSYNQPRREQRQQVIKAARELGMMVVPEGGSLLQHNLTMVADGHTGIEHAVPVANAYEDVRRMWGASDVGYTPTLIVGYGGLWGENYWYATTEVWEDERLLSFVPRELVDARSRRRVTAPEGEWGHFDLARTAAELHAAGVPVQIGAHGQREGLGAHWELWMLVQGGMSELDALRAATLGGAWYLGMDDDLGSIEPGKLADLAVIDGDPLTDVRQSKNVRYVVLNGRLYDAATLNQLAPEPSELEPLWWQRDPRDFAALGGEPPAGPPPAEEPPADTAAPEPVVVEEY
jgi:imidazolonepropionase-like amidohydrolase